MMIVLILVIGLSVGSFLNVLIDRLPRGESIMKKRSHCEGCKKEIAWYDLIPVASFMALSGKCRYCRSPIAWQYPLVEIITAGLFVGAVGIVGEIRGVRDISLLFYYLFIVSSLIVVFFADFKYGIIPDKIIYPSILISLGYLFILHPSSFILHLFSALGAFLFFLIIYLVTHRAGMGLGDVKFSFLLGLFLGFPQIIVALYVAFLTGAAISLILVLWGKKKLRGGAVPFGPFLVIGTLISFFWARPLLQVVLGLY